MTSALVALHMRAHLQFSTPKVQKKVGADNFNGELRECLKYCGNCGEARCHRNGRSCAGAVTDRTALDFELLLI